MGTLFFILQLLSWITVAVLSIRHWMQGRQGMSAKATSTEKAAERRVANQERKIAALVSVFAFIPLVASFYGQLESDKRQRVSDTMQLAAGRKIDTLRAEVGALSSQNDSLRRTNFVLQQGNTVINGDNASLHQENTSVVINQADKPLIEKFLEVNSFVGTGIFLKEGQRVVIEAYGGITVGGSGTVSGPEGTSSVYKYGGFNIAQNIRHAELMYRYGNGKEWKAAGRKADFPVEFDGQLFLEINDNRQSDNEGAYQVSVKVFEH